MPFFGYYPTNIIRPLTPKQLKKKMDAKAKKVSEKYRVFVR